MSPVAGGLDAARAVQLVAYDAAQRPRFGSGYLVVDGLVLTAAHVVADAVRIAVRFVAGPRTVHEVAGETAWADSRAGMDVALVRLAPATQITAQVPVRISPVRFGRISRPPVECEALGFPLFKMRVDPLAQGGGAVSRYRDSHHATGTTTSWSNRREGTLAIDVRAPERDQRPGGSPWEGMSGAAVFSGDCLIGVIGEHHRGDGLGTLAAYQVEHWFERLDADQLADLAAWIDLPTSREALIDVARAERPRATTLRQLPATTSAFTGREREMGELRLLAERAVSGRSPSTIVISAIDGMAGVGKTALAVRAAHAVAGLFPDGQLFVDLHGYTHGVDPRDPADTLADLLRVLGVPAGQVPKDLDARAALYRSRLAGSRTLILLDNAATEAQVRPLLPGGEGCLVVVTSRKRLTALDDAHPLRLDVLSASDAVTLFRDVAQLDDVSAEEPLVQEIVGLCGHLPLTLRIIAALFRNHESWTIRRLADRLRDGRASVAVFRDTDRDLKVVFDLSYQVLSDEQRRLFRLLGLIPGLDVDRYAAAALLDVTPDAAEEHLDSLVDHNVLIDWSAGRYRMHDLVRAYAHDLGNRWPADAQDAAMDRLLDYYQHTAGHADAYLARYTRPAPTGRGPTHEPTITSQDAARAWLRTERANLLPCIDYAADHGRDGHLVALATGLSSLLLIDGPWSETVTVHSTALAAAERLGDSTGSANALTELGAARYFTDDLPAAADDLAQALRRYRELDDQNGQANALTWLGAVRRVADDFTGAVSALEEALRLYRHLGDSRGRAAALGELGEAHRLMGLLPDAVRELEEAGALHRSLDDARGRAISLGRLGNARRLMGDFSEALRDLGKAVELHEALGDRHARAIALTWLADTRRSMGDLPGAVQDLEEAVGLCHETADRHSHANALTYLGGLRRLLGDLPGAARDLERALELHGEIGNRSGRAGALTELGIVLQATGDHFGAQQSLEAALALFRQTGERGNEAWALNHYAAIVAVTDGSARALAIYREALQLTRDVKQPDDEALALEGIGEILVRTGNEGDGIAHLLQARELFQNLGMQPDADRLRARLIDLGAER